MEGEPLALFPGDKGGRKVLGSIAQAVGQVQVLGSVQIVQGRFCPWNVDSPLGPGTRSVFMSLGHGRAKWCPRACSASRCVSSARESAETGSVELDQAVSPEPVQRPPAHQHPSPDLLYGLSSCWVMFVFRAVFLLPVRRTTHLANGDQRTDTHVLLRSAVKGCPSQDRPGDQLVFLASVDLFFSFWKE